MIKNKKQKVFLIVGKNTGAMVEKNKDSFKKEFGIVFYLILDRKSKNKIDLKKLEGIYDKIFFTNFSIKEEIYKTIIPFKKKVVGLDTYGDAGVNFLKKIVPFFPTLNNPTSDSLGWSNNKINMRKMFEVYDTEMTPKFLLISENTDNNILKIEKKIGYPLILKPTNMASSSFVTKCYHREELENALKNIFKKGTVIQRLRADFILGKKTGDVEVIAEEFMEGKMYSVDGIVNENGIVAQYPPVYVKTGKDAGFDDFFGHTRILPTKISEKKIEKIQLLVEKAIDSLFLVNTHFHIEIIKTEEGFKIVEIGTRLGGHREYMYETVYGISISRNDLLNKLGKSDISLTGKVKKHSAVMHIYAKKEGKITKISGINLIKKIEGIDSINQLKKKGDTNKFAKNGGSPVFKISLSSKERGELLGNIRRIEKELEIVI